MTIRELAIYYAGSKHKDKSYGDALYVHHLAAVDAVLGDVGYPPICTERITAWLHDTVEDTDAKLEEVEKLFGGAVRDCVWRVTNEPGENRKERAMKTYPKIAVSTQALAVKLADRIANIENSLISNSRFALMYHKEHPIFWGQLGKFIPMETPINVGRLAARYLDNILAVQEKYGIKD